MRSLCSLTNDLHHRNDMRDYQPPKIKKGFPCVICGQPRTSGSKANKYKICVACYYEIQNNKKPRSVQHVTKCVMCGADIDRYSVSPTCMLGNCRSKWYRNLEIKKQVDALITKQEYDKITLKINRLHELGYNVVITKMI